MIMDYEKKYKEALERARAINNGKDVDVEAGTTTCEYIFPELKEFEDEKIRKELIEHIKANKEEDYVLFKKFSPDDVLAWLEKQGGKKSTNKVEPRFKVGDWITNGLCTFRITSLDKNYYWSEDDTVGGDIESIDKQYHLWTIQDAKDGDVLITNSNIVFIFKYLDEGGTIAFRASCTKNSGVYFPKIKEQLCDQDVHPATKEQRDLLFAKMKEAGYEWDAEKKELKKVSQRMISAEVKEAMYTKPVWSEEDEITRKTLTNIVNVHYKDCFGKTEKCLLLNWLKSLERRISCD